MRRIFCFGFLLLFLGSACVPHKKKESQEPPVTKVEMLTSYGEIVLKLYNETPLHRDNFIKIVNDGVLDSVLFHRVIENFMIQGGDTQSKFAQPSDTLGNSDLPYTVPAEIQPGLFHKKGVLAAARDNNPERESSSTQFYIVQGKVFNDSLLDLSEKRINNWLATYYAKHDSAYASQLDSLKEAIKNEDESAVERFNKNFAELAKSYTNFEAYRIPESHRQVYKTTGGTPHLDQNYTIFGEVVSGLNVLDSIAAAETNALDRPLTDIRILRIKIMEE